MRRILWILGILCIIAAVLCIGDSRFFPRQWGRSLLILGFLFFGLESLFDRVAHLDSLLKPSATTGPNRIKTDVDDCARLHDVGGEATCAGCGGRAPKRDLCYNQPLDAYYHRACLARDLNWGNPSQSSKTS